MANAPIQPETGLCTFEVLARTTNESIDVWTVRATFDTSLLAPEVWTVIADGLDPANDLAISPAGVHHHTYDPTHADELDDDAALIDALHTFIGGCA